MQFDRLAFCALAAVATPCARAGEPSWIPTFGAEPGTNGFLHTLTVFDDGPGGGPALYAGGDFTSAGGVAANRVAKWDGTSWSALGSGMDLAVRALTVFDDGSGAGPALYAGGDFTSAGVVVANKIAKWDGASWSALGSGMNNPVRALTVFDDGSGAGPALFAGGSFTSAGGVAANRVAKWDGTSWSALGSGMNAFVLALTVFDDGSGGGAALYAGGQFTTAGGVAANRVAKWDGTSWSALGSGMGNTVIALTVFDDGSGGGPALYAAGVFVTAGGVAVHETAKWDGIAWSALGSGMNGSVGALTVFDDGSGDGPALYAAGFFNMAGGAAANGIARWDGTSWSALGSGMNGIVNALAVFDDGSGSGPALYVGGQFTTAAGVAANHIATWDGTSWSAFGGGVNDQVLALTVYDDGSGDGAALYAGGFFTLPGGVAANRIAKWDGTSWSALGSGINGSVYALTVFDDGSGGGPALYAGGQFTTAGGVAANFIARWDGTSWCALGTGMNSTVWALMIFDNGSGGGPALYAGGQFTTAGGAAANRIAKWDGTSWSDLGSGMNSEVFALTVFDDGAGGEPALYAGGFFTTAGGATANGVARWDGASWSALGSGVSGVHALTVFDDGSGGGPVLHAGGQFTAAGGVAANGIARWDGTSWSALGSGMDSAVYALTVFDDGSGGGPALYAGGRFTTAGGVAANRIAKWNGTSWSALGSGVNHDVWALAVFDDGSGGGSALYAGGRFTVSPAGDSYIAKWGLTGGACIGNLNGNGSVGFADLHRLLAAWGPCPGCPEDLDGSGVVEFVDLDILLGALGAVPLRRESPLGPRMIGPRPA